MPVKPNRRIQYGLIDRWAISGATLQRHRLKHQVSVQEVAQAMGLSVYRITQLERQQRTTHETVAAYLAALDTAWLAKAQRTPEERAAVVDSMNTKREVVHERQRVQQHERYMSKRRERDQQEEHAERWNAFLPSFKAGPLAAFIDQCAEPTDDVQADAAGEELVALYEMLCRSYRVRASVADLVRELERRGMMMRAGSVEVLVQRRDHPARGHRPGPSRMGTAHRPAYGVWCRLSDFGRRVLDASREPAAV